MSKIRPAEPADLETLRALLSSGARSDLEPRVRAAFELGAVGDADSAEQIEALLIETLERQNSHLFGFVAIAVERTGDVAAARRLQALIPDAPEWALYWLGRAIKRLSGHSAPPPEGVQWSGPERDAYVAKLREAWAALDLSVDPTPSVVWGAATDTRVEAVVHDGRGVFALGPDPTSGKATWPEWNYSWYHAGQGLYGVGTVCSTCEVYLHRAGWSPQEAVDLAQSVRSAVADVRTLDRQLLDAIEPVVGALASSRYQLRLIDQPLEPVTWMDTWYTEDALEGVTDPDDLADITEDPVNHERLYQPPHTGRPNPLVIAPTQPDLDPATVKAYVQAITDGARPAALVAAHLGERHNWDREEPHTAFTGFVVDGHHKLAAYAELGIAARIILILDLTPPLRTPGDPSAALDGLLVETGGIGV
ncbi:hypothetical protein GCM10009839_09870 [Catenulispora yoronensis]|uniref:Uncharacterized protein n=1 Tax=Catenulispora yoronensis TaxID=450799 RepID=A0ABN2TPE7_9ACTN